jgi:hypothetical protein
MMMAAMATTRRADIFEEPACMPDDAVSGLDRRRPGQDEEPHRRGSVRDRDNGEMEPVIQLLTECGAEGIEHPGGYLLSHLKRVSALLDGWGARPALRAAGLGHAFYGTDGFPTALVDVADRGKVRQVLGEEAEGIVYRYAACDRGFSYAGLSNGGPFRDRFTGETGVLTAGQRRDFVELTVANELDLLIVNAQLRARYGEALDRLFTRCREHMSDQAWLAVRDVMG